LRKFAIIVPVMAVWVIISVGLILYSGIGFAMLFFVLSFIIFAVILRNPAILERVRGEKYTTEQRAHLAEITSSGNFRILFIGILIIFTVLTVILLLYNYRMIDFIGN